jgi:hypothetical protein
VTWVLATALLALAAPFVAWPLVGAAAGPGHGEREPAERSGP